MTQTNLTSEACFQLDYPPKLTKIEYHPIHEDLQKRFNHLSVIRNSALKDDLNLLAARLSDELSKYIYFLLAASGAAIAYALEQVEGKVLSKELVLVILALFAWCGSFYFGVRHLHLNRQRMIENANALLEEETFQEMQKRLFPIIERMEKASHKQYVLFVIGVFLYISWRVVVLFKT